MLFVKNIKKATVLTNYKAFTLAEVLITLAIIGIVAAITIPTLMNSTQNAEFINKMKKEHSILSQAQQALIADYGSFPDAISDCTTFQCVVEKLATKLSYIKECTTSGDCMVASGAKYLNGTDASSIVSASNNGLVLKDGTTFVIYIDSYNCTASYSAYIGQANNECGWVLVDVNGLKKPNQFGKDIYSFRMFANSIRPTNDSGNSVGDCTSGSTGTTCAYKYLYTNN